MPMVDVNGVGRFGIVSDIDAFELPPEVWSDGNNVRFQDGKVKKMPGQSAVFDPPSVAPYALFPAPQNSVFYWIYCGLSAVYNVTGSTHDDMTHASGVNAVNTIPWTGGMFNGVMILNNGIDTPMMWNPGGAGNNLVDLTGFAARADACRIMRPFENYLMAFDVTISGVRYPYLTKWSHLADPGAVPTSWDETDATKDAGDSPKLADTPGYVLDALPLGNNLVIYKEDAIFGCQHIGGQFIFRIWKAIQEVGMLTHRCMCALPKGRHFVVTNDDIIVHNLSSAESIIDKQVKRNVFNELDVSQIIAAHVVPNYAQKEVWFCYPSGAATWCDKALIWHYIDGTFSYRDLPGTFHANIGLVDEAAAETWDADNEAWDDDVTIWDDRAFEGLTRDVLLADTVNTKLLRADETEQFNGTNMTAFVERTDLGIAGQDREGNIKVDYAIRKMFRAVWIRATGSPFKVKLGTQQVRGGAVTWQTERTFTPGTDDKVDFIKSGVSIAIHFESTDNSSWTIEGYSLDIELLGKF